MPLVDAWKMSSKCQQPDAFQPSLDIGNRFSLKINRWGKTPLPPDALSIVLARNLSIRSDQNCFRICQRACNAPLEPSPVRQKPEKPESSCWARIRTQVAPCLPESNTISYKMATHTIHVPKACILSISLGNISATSKSSFFDKIDWNRQRWLTNSTSKWHNLSLINDWK